MSSFGARFNETDYIKVDIDFATGVITWDESSDGGE